MKRILTVFVVMSLISILCSGFVGTIVLVVFDFEYTLLGLIAYRIANGIFDLLTGFVVGYVIALEPLKKTKPKN